MDYTPAWSLAQHTQDSIGTILPPLQHEVMQCDDERKPQEKLRYNQWANQCLFIQLYLMESQRSGEKMINAMTSSSGVTAWCHPLSTEQSPTPPPLPHELRPDEVFVLCVQIIVIASPGFTRCAEILVLFDIKEWMDGTQEGHRWVAKYMFCWPPISEVLL